MPGMCCLALRSPASCSSRSSCQAGPEGPRAGKEQKETRKALRYFFIINYIPGTVAPLAAGGAVEGIVSGIVGTVQFSKLGFFALYLLDQFSFTAAPSGGFTLTVFISFEFPEGLWLYGVLPPSLPPSLLWSLGQSLSQKWGWEETAGWSQCRDGAGASDTNWDELSCGFMVKVCRAPSRKASLRHEWKRHRPAFPFP